MSGTRSAIPARRPRVRSPYQPCGVASAAWPAVGQVPLMLTHRRRSVRAYDQAGMLLDASVTVGAELEGAVHRLFAAPAVGYLHIHDARPGCDTCRVVRA